MYKVSIVIPVYNASKYLKLALDSVVNQTYSNLEILIADDASTDNSKQIIESYSDSRIKLYHNLENIGYLKTCNKLFALATGDYITFQDADDISTIDRIEKQIALFDENHNVACITTDCNVINSEGVFLEYRTSEIDYSRYRTDAAYNPIICYNSMIFTREVYAKIGGYQLAFDRIGFEDYDYFFRILMQFEVANIAVPLFDYRIHESEVKRHGTNNPAKYYAYDLFLYIRKYFIENNEDILDVENHRAYIAKITELEKPYLDDPTLILKEHTFYAINRRHYYKGFINAIMILRKFPFKHGSIKHLVYSVYIIFRRLIG